MTFPEIENRVIYNKNPLTEVICQFQYPTILRIDNEPIDFQEKIRNEYPIFREKIGKVQLPQEFAQLLPQEFISTLGNRKAFEFATKDNIWAVSLTRDFIALTNSSYTQWEDFFAKLRGPFQSLDEVYQPSFFSRVGLRYQNVIQRSKLQLENVDWSKLINPVLGGFLSDINYAQQVEDCTHITLLRLKDDIGKVRIRYGLVQDNDTGELCFLIDSDFFAEGERDIQNGFYLINEFNRQNRNFFRWCITNELHAAMEPVDL